jgi:predicted nucleic acid-binding protein
MRYLDPSAITKLLFLEPGTVELRAALGSPEDAVTSVLSRVEVQRAVARRDPASVAPMASLLATFSFLELDGSVVATASTLPTTLRTGDALHVASALQLGADLDAFVTYDARLADAARTAGLDVQSPGVDLAVAPATLTTVDPAAIQRVVDRLVGRLRPARILLPETSPDARPGIVIVLGPWSPGRAASQLGREAVADLEVDVDLVVIQDEDASSTPPGAMLYEGD